MHNAQTVLSHHSQAGQVDLSRFGGILAEWLTRLFGCWHGEMSRPFTSGKETYRVCMDCGARRNFDPVRWEMVGGYYYSLPAANESYGMEKRAQSAERRATPLRLAA